ncbi:MAG: preprotein translocase subunit SecA, partial [Thiohalobacterales bacterium]|nr:preprotein translocase subunit SecA [Thiohalobacterales bacterium]
IQQVDRAAERLDGMSDVELKYQARANSQLLQSEGLTDRHVAMAFAIIREASGRTLGMRHHDVQLMAGRVLMNGMLAEMETGEGKTLMASLPAATAALAGIPVHVITVNDYLAGRDAEKMSPLYSFLGLSVETVREDMDEDAKRAAYAADITYCTNKQVAFDYLRDRVQLRNSGGRVSLQAERLAGGGSRLDSVVMRGLCFAIVDEADSVLIDEAATPLILTQSGLTCEAENRLYKDAVALSNMLEPKKHFDIDESRRRVTLTEAGQDKVESVAKVLGGQWKLRARREELATQALTARYLFLRDREYLVRDGEVLIIDDLTGRVMGDRKWERGLHQMIEIREGCEPSPPNEVLARISYQRFFRRYLHLCGMTGTARETAGELDAVYGLRVRKIPTHVPSKLKPQGETVYASSAARWQRLVERLVELRSQGRPVLVGTRSVADSEHLGSLLEAAGMPHQILNAAQDADEAALVACAGEAGAITIATNMAGRGTDIPLAEGVADTGGLHVIAAERNTARRVDRQLFGRTARQGAPGSYESILSLEDRVVRDYMPKFLGILAARYATNPGPLPVWLGSRICDYCQRRSEKQQRLQRRALEKMDEHLGRMLAFSGEQE